MIKNAKNSISQYLSMSNIIFVLLFLFTFDRYSLDFVTPETPFFTIAKLPFLRMEFISIVFCLAFLCGVVLAMLLKKHSNKLIKISTMFVGVIAIVLGIVDVNLFQILFPTMRISHVIMSVSRITGIVLGASGLFVGISIACSVGQKGLSKTIIYAVIAATALSLIAVSESFYNFIYILVGALIILIAVMSQYYDIKQVADVPKVNLRSSLCNQICVFFGVAATVITALLGYQFITVTLQASITIYALTMATAIVLFILCAKYEFHMVSKIILIIISLAVWILNIILPTLLLTITAIVISAVTMGVFSSVNKAKANYIFAVALGMLVAAVIAYVLNHYFSVITKYSGNRVVYEVKALAWLVPIAMAMLFNLLSVLPNKRKEIKD